MLDWDRLVLAPTMDVFAVPIVVTPLASQPSVAPYAARGVWAVKPIDVQMENESIMSSQTNRLGIRLSEFAIPVVPGDEISISGKAYVVDDTDDDGQGGTELTLKALE